MLSDTITLGLILILVFGSVCLYLYTRIQQAETKINLLESILLDLKMTNELKSYPDIPFNHEHPAVEVSRPSSPVDAIKPFDDVPESTDMHTVSDVPIAGEDIQFDNVQPSVDALYESVPEGDKAVKVVPNYESMTLKELSALAKQRSITGASSMRRAQIIEALKTSDSSVSFIAEPLATISEE